MTTANVPAHAALTLANDLHSALWSARELAHELADSRIHVPAHVALTLTRALERPSKMASLFPYETTIPGTIPHRIFMIMAEDLTQARNMAEDLDRQLSHWTWPGDRNRVGDSAVLARYSSTLVARYNRQCAVARRLARALDQCCGRAEDLVVYFQTLAFQKESEAGPRPEQLKQKAVKGPWPKSPAAQLLANRLLRNAARLLPRNQRANYIREQAANLACSETPGEWMSYLVDQLGQMPQIAFVYRRERRRRPVQ